MIFIAQKSKGGAKVGMKDIAKGIDAPEFFVAKILQDLSRKGLVQSLKGPSGGFYFEDTSLKHTLADVVKAVDGDKLFTGCGLGLKQCSASKPCPIHNQFKQIRQDIYEMLQASRLGEFNQALEKKLLFLKR